LFAPGHALNRTAWQSRRESPCAILLRQGATEDKRLLPSQGLRQTGRGTGPPAFQAGGAFSEWFATIPFITFPVSGRRCLCRLCGWRQRAARRQNNPNDIASLFGFDTSALARSLCDYLRSCCGALLIEGHPRPRRGPVVIETRRPRYGRQRRGSAEINRGGLTGAGLPDDRSILRPRPGGQRHQHRR
jgi:hypothetical protein